MTCLMNTSTAYPYAALQGDGSSAEVDDLGEAFAAALRQSDWDAAEGWLHAAAGQEDEDTAAWALRRGDWYLAQQRWDEAESHLKGLLAAEARADDLFQMAVHHNLASIAFMRRDDAGCVAWLSSVLEVDGVAKPLPQGFRAAEMLWVRALHRSHAVDRLLRWATQLDASGQLDAVVAGVASLASWERGDLALTRRWIAMGRSKGEAASAECLVAAVFLSIADRASRAEAEMLAEEVCIRWPADGRSWVARGLAKLLAGDGESANSDLEHAIATAPDYVPAWRGLGWARMLVGKTVAAEQSFQSALKLDDKHSESHGGLAVSLVMQQRESEARDCLQTCQNLNVGSQSGLYAKRLLTEKSEAMLDLPGLLVSSARAPSGA